MGDVGSRQRDTASQTLHDESVQSNSLAQASSSRLQLCLNLPCQLLLSPSSHKDKSDAAFHHETAMQHQLLMLPRTNKAKPLGHLQESLPLRKHILTSCHIPKLAAKWSTTKSKLESARSGYMSIAADTCQLPWFRKRDCPSMQGCCASSTVKALLTGLAQKQVTHICVTGVPHLDTD